MRLHGGLRQGVGQGAVGGEIHGILVHDGADLPDLPLQLHPGRAFPAALVKEHRHEVAGGDHPAVPGKVVAQDLPGRIVGPDEVGGGVEIPAALGGALQNVDAHLLIVAVFRAEGGLVVAEEDQDHRGLVVPEAVDVSGKLPSRVGHAV